MMRASAALCTRRAQPDGLLLACASRGVQIWGFDVLLDEDLRAWLIEANTCPALAGDTPLDRRLKTAMVGDALHLVGALHTSSKHLAHRLAATTTTRSGIHLR